CIDVNHTHLPKTLDQQSHWLKTLGFSDNSIQSIWPEIISKSALSHKKNRDELIRKEFLFTFVNQLSLIAHNKDLALAVFLDFVRSARAKSTLFTLILRNQKLLNKLVILFSHSPYMGQVIASRPELIDSFLYGLHELSDDTEESLQILFEKRQLAEIHSAIDFFETFSTPLVQKQLSDTADEIARDLKKIVLKEIPQAQFTIVALGKWGSQELGYKSDLDFILVKNGEINGDDHRAAKRFLNYLTSPQRGGKIYNIDLRLRPSGSSGPLLVSVKTLIEYFENQAQPWERQSYIRMRPLEALPSWKPSLIFSKPLTPQDLAELKRIRLELHKPSNQEKLDIKYSAGGLIDIEFAIQISILKKQILPTKCATVELLSLLTKSDPLWQAQADELLEHYKILKKSEELLRLITDSSNTTMTLGGESLSRIAQIENTLPEKVFSKLLQTLTRSEQILKNLDPIHQQD
ncbi:MAG: hypothetical protein KDD34_00320, partial [Bdellovibrionales bacterium]|nr:hypothetical protein [Bdellovibrionales bacterium]